MSTRISHKLQEELAASIKVQRESLEQVELSPKQRSSACLAILEAIENFLCKWEDNDIASCPESELPNFLIQRSLNQVVTELGPGNSKLRDNLWAMLRSRIKTVECRQVILDFVPATIPIESDEELDKLLNKEMYDIFRTILEKENGSAEQILGCLSRLVRSGRIDQKDCFEFELGIINLVHECDLTLCLKMLLTHMGHDDSNALKVVDVLRQELTMLEDSEDFTSTEQYDAHLAEGIFNASKKENGPRFLQAYVDTLDDEIASDESSGSVLLLYDMLVLLLCLEDDKYIEVKRILNGALMRDCLTQRTWNRLVRVCNDEGNEMHEALVELILELPLLILSAPIANEELVRRPGAITTCRYLISTLAIKLCGETQQNLIASLFSVLDGLESEKAVIARDSLSVENRRCGESQSSEQQKKKVAEGWRSIHRSVFEIFGIIARKNPHALKPSRNRIVDRLFSPRSHLYDSELINILCSILASLDDRGVSYTGQLPYSIQTTRSLLYSSLIHDLKSNATKTERSCRGIVLAIEVLKLSHLDNSNILTLFGIVQSFLTTPNRLSHPQLKLYCVKFLAAWNAWSRNRLPEDSFSATKSKVYSIVQSLFSNAGIIQNISSFAKWKGDGATLCLQYTERPTMFQRNQSEGEGRKKCRYFSFESIIENSSSASWIGHADWISELTRTYFFLGRDVNKWDPYRWGEAAIEFPRLEISQFTSLGSRRRRALDLFNTVMRDIELPFFARSDGPEKEFFESIKRIKDRIILEKIVEFLLRFSFSLMLGLSMSKAVFQNSYEQLKQDSFFSEMHPDAVKLLQFQFFKIYDMIEVCRLAERVLSKSIKQAANRLLTSTSRKRKRLDLRAKADAEAVDKGSEQLRDFCKQLLQSAYMIEPEALWACIVDPTHNKLIMQAVEGLKDGSIKCSEQLLLQVINSRLNIMDHLISVASYSGADIQGTASGLAVNRSKFAQCLKLSAYISLNLLDYRKNHTIDSNNEVFKNLSILTASSFHLLHVAMILNLESVDASDEDTVIGGFFLLYQSILGTDEPMKHVVQSNEAVPTSPIDAFHSISGAFLNHFKDCDDAAIRCQLIESWSVFALRYEKVPCSTMADITSNALKAQYSISNIECFRAPYIFLYTLNRLLPASLSKKTEKNDLEKSVYKSLVERAFDDSIDKKEAFWVVGLCRHWGVLILMMENGDSTIYYHLSELFSNLVYYIHQVHGSKSARVNKKKKRDAASDEDDDYVPPAEGNLKAKAPRSLEVEGVDDNSFPFVFDMLLRISVATASMLSIDREAANPKINSLRTRSPYSRFESFLRFFGSLICIYQRYFSVFPTKTLGPVLRVSSCMVFTSSSQLQRFIKWRNTQPIADANDPASVEFLRGVFDSIQVHVVDTLQSLFAQLDRSSDSVSSSGKHLEARVKKLKEELRQEAETHRHASLGSNLEATSYPVGNDDWTILDPFGCLEFPLKSHDPFGSLEFPLKSHGRQVAEEPRGARRESTAMMSPRRVIRSEDSASHSDEASTSSGSFGAQGDWLGAEDIEDDARI